MSTLREILGNSQYWGLTLSIAAYLFACWLLLEDKACLFKSDPGICYRDHCIFTGSRN